MSGNIRALDLILEDYEHVTTNRMSALAKIKNDCVIITGGTGFIGTWLTGLLAYLNDVHHFNIHIILVARDIEKFKRAKPHLANRKDVKLVATDVRNLMELPAETNWIIHAAAIPDNRFHATNPLETIAIIMEGTKAVLRAAERCSNLKMYLHISSGLVYGAQPLNLPAIDENYLGAIKCNTVTSAYAEAKRCAETLCSAARSQARIPVITVRPFAFIGPYQTLEAPWAINNFIKDALHGNSIRVLGDGETVRSYLYASDMAFWLLTILTNAASGDIYNVGSSEEITLMQLAKMISLQFVNQPEIKLRTAAANNVQTSRFIPDVSLAKKNLSLTATINLETAIHRTIQWNKLLQNF